jgi:hypothetical protein
MEFFCDGYLHWGPVLILITGSAVRVSIFWFCNFQSSIFAIFLILFNKRNPDPSLKKTGPDFFARALVSACVFI